MNLDTDATEVMMILSDAAIENGVKSGDIVLDPFKPEALGPNSYDLTLGRTLKIYTLAPNDGITRIYEEKGRSRTLPTFLDARTQNPVSEVEVGPEGIVLVPGMLYLAHTQEVAGTRRNYVPMLEGRSSLARLGLFVHVTAGFGDVGYVGQWTLEMAVVHPLRIYAGMRICQVYFHTLMGEPNRTYKGKYQEAEGVVESRSYLDREFAT